MQHAVLRADQLSLTYDDRPVVQDVSLSFDAPGTVAVTGPSGSGKTSLLHCLAGLERDHVGTVTLLGRDFASLSADELAALRLGSVGFVFQSSDLVPELTLRQNIALPLELARVSRREVGARVDELVERLGLGESASRRPNRVSGGQAQRCAVARAVVARPRVVFADEPTGALDCENREIVLDLLLDEVRAIEGLLVAVTHDPDVAARFDDQVVLTDGRVVVERTAHVHGRTV